MNWRGSDFAAGGWIAIFCLLVRFFCFSLGALIRPISLSLRFLLLRPSAMAPKPTTAARSSTRVTAAPAKFSDESADFVHAPKKSKKRAVRKDTQRQGRGQRNLNFEAVTPATARCALHYVSNPPPLCPCICMRCTYVCKSNGACGSAFGWSSQRSSLGPRGRAVALRCRGESSRPAESSLTLHRRPPFSCSQINGGRGVQ